MKAFVLTQDYPIGASVGGAEIQALLLAEYLKKREYETAFVALRENASFQPDGDVKVFGLEKSKVGLKECLKKLGELLEKEKPDILFVRNFQYLYFIFRVAKKAGVPVVYNTTHIKNCRPILWESFLPGKNYFLRLREILLHFLNFTTLKRISGVVTINKAHAKILKRYSIKASSIYNSMENNYFPVRKEKKVVWVSNIKSRKNPEFFIEVAERLKNSGYEFLMVGDIHEEKYKELIYQAQKGNNAFKYLGSKTVKEVDEILASSEIFANTCEIEGFGNNLIQAWLSECPTVVLKFDPDGIIKENKIGFHSGSVEQMIKDLNSLFEHPNERKEMGKRARIYAVENHQMDKNVLKYEKFFNEILNNKKIK